MGSLISILLGAGAVALWVKLRDTFFCALKIWFCWVWSTLIGYMIAPAEAVLDAIPDLPDSAYDFGEVIYCMDYWFPIFELLGFELTYWTVYGSWVVVRVIKSFIPTVAN